MIECRYAKNTPIRAILKGRKSVGAIDNGRVSGQRSETFVLRGFDVIKTRMISALLKVARGLRQY